MWEFESVDPKIEPYHLKGRGFIHYVIAPKSMQYKHIDAGALNGNHVKIDGKVYMVVGVETFMIGRGPDQYLSEGCNWRVGLCVKEKV